MPSDPAEPTSSPDATSGRDAAIAEASAAAAAEKLIGTVIPDRYRLVELIAAGGMGAVYKAEHLLLRKWVAVKLLHRETSDFPEHVARFEREAIAGAHLQHPNIASATDFGELPGGSYFLVLEYLRGVPLDQVIREGPLPPARALKIARQIAAALAAAHERGVIHRDVKPRNVMLDPANDHLVKLIDFGLAKVPLERLSTTHAGGHDGSETHRITRRNMVFGTVAYMAPETADGMERVDECSDLYALGIIFYEMLSGEHPFDAAGAREMFHQQCTAIGARPRGWLAPLGDRRGDRARRGRAYRAGRAPLPEGRRRSPPGRRRDRCRRARLGPGRGPESRPFGLRGARRRAARG